LISIAMPVLNCERTVGLAVASVLNQHHENWELLAMDDGSSDRTVEILQSIGDPRIRVIVDGQHRGLPARLNHAIDLARGAYFARMDGDDIAYPERLRRQLEYLLAHPEVDLLGARMVMFRGQGEAFGFWRGPSRHEAICGKAWAPMRLAHPTWLGRTSWFRQYRYCTRAARMEDRELLFRSAARSRFAALPEVLMGYREEHLSLKKSLTGRRHGIKVQLRYALQQRRYGYAALTIGAELGKAFLDTAAVTTHLGYALVPYRAPALTPALAARFAEVWSLTCLRVPRLQSGGTAFPPAQEYVEAPC